ncbi:MAG: hypothetical protein QXS23_02670 [Desulfurococcaceae archaeon]
MLNVLYVFNGEESQETYDFLTPLYMLHRYLMILSGLGTSSKLVEFTPVEYSYAFIAINPEIYLK